MPPGDYNRIVVMSSQGFAQPVPYARVAEIAAMPGVDRRSRPFSWYGGKYNEEVMPFAQFGVDAETFFSDATTTCPMPARSVAGRGRRTGPAA